MLPKEPVPWVFWKMQLGLSGQHLGVANKRMLGKHWQAGSGVCMCACVCWAPLWTPSRDAQRDTRGTLRRRVTWPGSLFRKISLAGLSLFASYWFPVAVSPYQWWFVSIQVFFQYSQSPPACMSLESSEGAGWCPLFRDLSCSPVWPLPPGC
jgi:hypothetical protein